MSDVAVYDLFRHFCYPKEFEGKRILEVGSKYVNGSVRPLIERFCYPKEYIGVDIEEGRGVDLMLPAEKLEDHFGEETFDIVLTTELLEHIKDWRSVMNKFKNNLKKEGLLFITTRSKGFPYYGYPYNFSRYEINDMKKIFSDFDIITLRKDYSAPSIFLKAKKPQNYPPNNLKDIKLYLIIIKRRTKQIIDIRDESLFKRFNRIISMIIVK